MRFLRRLFGARYFLINYVQRLIMKNKVIREFMCESCYQAHNRRDKALSCCVQGNLVELFRCPVCKKQFGKQDLALKCCGSGE